MRSMTIPEAYYLAISLMEEFNVHGQNAPYFKFKWGRGKKQLGACHYLHNSTEGRYISLSRSYVKLNSDELIEDTIRHEIAHALDVMDRGYSDHSWRWKTKCRLTGANPSRLKSNVKAPKAKYESTCSCGKTYKRHRISSSSTYRCPRCRDQLFVRTSVSSPSRPLTNIQYSLSNF